MVIAVGVAVKDDVFVMTTVIYVAFATAVVVNVVNTSVMAVILVIVIAITSLAHCH